MNKQPPYKPIESVVVGKKDIADAMAFWVHFKVPFVKIPGLKEFADELLAKPELTVDDIERLKYLLVYEITHSDHEAFKDELFAHIRVECAEVLAAMEAYYPGRVWI